MELNKKQGLWFLAGMLLLGACASTGSRFGKIYPGMSTDQVVQTMGKGPQKTEGFSDNYSAWYYNEDTCLLVQSDKVVSKSVTEKQGALEVWGLGGATERKLAECLPPGYKSTKKVQREVETPFGTLKR